MSFFSSTRLAYAIAAVVPPCVLYFTGIAIYLLDISPLTAGMALLFAPALPIALVSVFARPKATGPLSEDPVEDSGTGFARSWVRVGGRVHWVGVEKVQDLRTTFVVPDYRGSPSGFTLQIPVAEPPDLTVWVLARVFSLGALGLVLPTFLALTNLLSGTSTLSEALGFIALVSGIAVSGYGIALIPWWLALMLFDGNARLGGATVELHGRRLNVGEQSFLVGQTEQRLTLTWNRSGTLLTVSNPEKTMCILGRHAELAWLAEQLRSLPPLEGSEQVPVALRTLQSTH